ncbi:Predicted integral membrane protein [Haladaptatus paucihalophilus DX253]|uniref:Predicted integral membrane protein n=2 Tax=Haladaptatus paucihalophilus DX253 TaxID=797209 RepID=A0A1M6R115_HALPU|nr:hypothetical protein HAL_34510 [Haladaptatus sp. T7]SHK26090.1 Predicted integral membrane protein [Haladaptatus paucihalophilus DX253]
MMDITQPIVGTAMSQSTPTYLHQIREITEESSLSFLVSAVLLPLSVVGATVLIDDPLLLLYAHIVSGTVWFGMAIVFPAALILYLGTASPERAKAFTQRVIPKVVVFMLVISFTTVLSGSLLAEQFGLLHADNPWMLRVFVLGWLLWLFGLLVSNRMHLTVYFEGQAPSPDPSRLKSIEKRILLVGTFETAVMLGIIFLVLNPGFRFWSLL